jgi:DNA-binding transcriptional ArsR family regulator
MTYHSALAAISDPMRRTILERIVAAPQSVGEIARDLPISRPAVSQHLKVLKNAALVHEERAGTKRIYHADSAALGELRAYVDGMWRAALGSFSEAVEAAAGEKQ